VNGERFGKEENTGVKKTTIQQAATTCTASVDFSLLLQSITNILIV
jgi:hypothetical protein